MNGPARALDEFFALVKPRVCHLCAGFVLERAGLKRSIKIRNGELRTRSISPGMISMVGSLSVAGDPSTSPDSAVNVSLSRAPLVTKALESALSGKGAADETLTRSSSANVPIDRIEIVGKWFQSTSQHSPVFHPKKKWSFCEQSGIL
jgi:hypothetical protein